VNELSNSSLLSTLPDATSSDSSADRVSYRRLGVERALKWRRESRPRSTVCLIICREFDVWKSTFAHRPCARLWHL